MKKIFVIPIDIYYIMIYTKRELNINCDVEINYPLRLTSNRRGKDYPVETDGIKTWEHESLESRLRNTTINI
jgi:hypothetical protein